MQTGTLQDRHFSPTLKPWNEASTWKPRFHRMQFESKQSGAASPEEWSLRSHNRTNFKQTDPTPKIIIHQSIIHFCAQLIKPGVSTTKIYPQNIHTFQCEIGSSINCNAKKHHCWMRERVGRPNKELANIVGMNSSPLLGKPFVPPYLLRLERARAKLLYSLFD